MENDDEILLNVWKKDEEDVFCIDMDLVSEEIRKHAYYKWQDAGCPHGKDVDFWLEAEEEIHSLLGIFIPKDKFMLV
jgi:hypothetical protein